MSETSRIEEDLNRVRTSARQLGEFFDTVQVFATRHDPATEDGTVRVDSGVGNWYARYGQVVEWVERENEIARSETKENE